VADDDVIANNNVAVAMNHTIILDTGIFADSDFAAIAPDNGSRPDTRSRPDFNITDDVSGFTDEHRWIDFRISDIKFTNHLYLVLGFKETGLRTDFQKFSDQPCTGTL
jgi:hypothetical protein